MIFTKVNESNEIVFIEGFKFKTKEEAERALEKVSNNETETYEYIRYCFDMAVSLFGFGILGIVLIQACTKWLAFPGSVNDKINKCDTIIKNCDKQIKKLRKENSEDSKKMIADFEKVRKKAVDEKEKYEIKARDHGKVGANWKESAIFENVNFI